MENIIQTSCSELLVDTHITDPAEAYKALTKLMKDYNWEASPPLTEETLTCLVLFPESTPKVVIYDKDGNRTRLEFGYNGYINTGFRLDSECCHCDSTCYPIFQKVIEKLNGQLISCDGGDKKSYERWSRGETIK